MTALRLATLLSVAAVTLAGCGGHPAVRPPATPRPTVSATAVPLAPEKLLGVSFLAPTGWRARRTVNGPADGFVTYTAPDLISSVYVEVNSCSACVDRGLITTGSANGIPDPDEILGQTGARSIRRLSPTRTAFTSRLRGTGPLLHNLLIIIAGDNTVSGYVLVEVAPPVGQPQLTELILASVRVPATLG
ncbi:MAG TPA: hypothetical protein VNG13_01000 [Mycobacteriales bacterium]|nr:hypothetical protein [Mycobacteriales bacterium]